MDTTTKEACRDNILTQYELLQSRVALHGNRMWQLPLTYLGTIAVTLSVTSSENPSVQSDHLFLMMSILGVFLTWALHGAYEGYSRTVKNMNKLEVELGLNEFTKNHLSHSVPYFSVMIMGIACCFMLA